MTKLRFARTGVSPFIRAARLNVKSAYKRGRTGTGNVSFLTIFQLARQDVVTKMATPQRDRILHVILTPFAGKHAP